MMKIEISKTEEDKLTIGLEGSMLPWWFSEFISVLRSNGFEVKVEGPPGKPNKGLGKLVIDESKVHVVKAGDGGKLNGGRNG